MTITFENLGGVGVNVNYAVRRDGKLVGYIRRTHSRDFIGIYSRYYAHKLWECRGIDRAKQKAIEITYPTKEEIYETICAEVEQARRSVLEQGHAYDLARIGRDLVAGSNSARVELEQLLADIELKARDREGDSLNSFFSRANNTRYPRKDGE